MRMVLTDKVVGRKAPASGTLQIYDTLLPAFGIRIGKKKRTYFVMGRVGGKQVRRTVGSPAEMTLAQARDKAREMLMNFRDGVDPSDVAKAKEAEERLAAEETERGTFRTVAADYMRQHGSKLKSGEELQRKLDKDILPEIGDIPIHELGREDIKRLYQAKAATGSVAANRVLALVRAILHYAEDDERIDNLPSLRRIAESETPRDRDLTWAEIKSFWRGLDEATIEPQLCCALRFLLVTGQRRTEALHATWDEFDFTPGNEWWEIPAARTKAGRTHRVPMSSLALNLLDEMAEYGSGIASNYVFPNGAGEAFHPRSLTQGMRKNLPIMGLADQPATVHDLRRTFSSRLGEMEVSRFIIGKLLNHAEQGVTGRVYDKYDYAIQKRATMDAWGTCLEQVITGQRRDNVVELFNRNRATSANAS